MHTGQTDNYELTQFASSDKPAWLTDYNNDMRKIDTQMKVNADAIEAVAENVGEEDTEIEGIKDRLDTAELDIDNAEETIGAGELQTTAQDLISAVNEILSISNQNSGDIDTVEQAIAGIGDSITALNQLAYTIANIYDSTSTYEVGNYAIYQNTLYKCNTAITVGEAFTPAKWTSVKVMNEVGSGGGVTASAVSFDNTGTSLSATNAQNAIVELAPKTTPDVSVTGDGVKTLGTILNELGALVDYTKINRNTIMLQKSATGTSRTGHISEWYNPSGGSENPYFIFEYSTVDKAQDNSVSVSSRGIKVSNTDSIAVVSTSVSTTTGVTVLNETSVVVGNGDSFEIYY